MIIIEPIGFIILPFLYDINIAGSLNRKLFHSKTITSVTGGYNLQNFKPF
jgi:hypothetical protein